MRTTRMQMRSWAMLSALIQVSLAVSIAAFTTTSAHGAWERIDEGHINGQIAQAFNGGMSISKPFLVDYDHDGDLDLFVGRHNGSIRFYRNDGTPNRASFTLADDQFLGIIGSFSGSQFGSHNCPALADIDGDGDLDLIYGEYTGTLQFYRNDGSPTAPVYVQSTQYFGSISVTDFSQPVFCDIDGDQDLDLFVGYGVYPGGQSGGIAFYRNTGTATAPNFVQDPTIAIPTTGADLHPTFVDIDGDGDLDCFVGAYGGSLNFYRNTGSRTAPVFVSETSPLPAFAADRWISPTFEDLDHDGDMDCFVGGMCGSILYFENKGTSSAPAFAEPTLDLPGISFALEVGGWGWERGSDSAPALVDIDGDGDLDLFAGHASPGQISFYRNDGSPQNAAFTFVTDEFAGIHFTSNAVDSNFVLSRPCFGDIDADGDLDLFIGKADGHIMFYRNDGALTFSLVSEQYLDVPGKDGNGRAVCSPTLVDYDGDGDLDFVVGKLVGMPSPGPIYLFRNHGTATSPSFSGYEDTGVTIPTGSFPKPAFCDIDRDGDMDLFVGVGQATSGVDRIMFYRNTGSATSPAYTLEDDQYASNEANYNWPSPEFGDLNGDGDPDLLVGYVEGGLNFYQNTAPHLLVRPASVTLVSGQSIDFETTGTISGLVTWHFVDNRSSGTLNTMTGQYSAGAANHVIDSIEARDSSGTLGRAYVNVISAGQLAASGKAVVMAGRKAGDTLWPATNSLAHSIYRTLLYRGFSKANIHYLNPIAAQDVDGDGDAGNDIAAPSSLANFESAMNTFAPGSPNLLVYLIDHGDALNDGTLGFVRCNETDVLYASQLKTMLDDLQANHGVTTVTLVVDCCRSGSFLRTVSGAPAGKARVVITSAGASQPAFFSAGGLISFTNSMVTSIYSGLPLGQAFRLAAGAMDRYQQPALDDTGDGIYNRDEDLAIADRMTIGATFIAGADRPQIGTISPNQTLTSGTQSATIWAADVSSAYPIERVWATIAAPNFIPQSQADPGQPVTGLPTLELAWNSGNNRYETTTNALAELGAYTVNLYAQDIWGGVSYPKQTYINQTASDERMIIVCGDGAYDSNSPWANSSYLAGEVYQTALARWFTPERVAYLSSATGPGVDQPPTKANLQSAIAAAGSAKLTIYLVGCGNVAAFDIDGDGADADDLPPAELKGWLDGLQSGGSISVTVVLDFNQSGAWLGGLIAPAGRQRVVIASCGAGEASWCEEGGMLSFSQWFFNKLFNGVNLRDAFASARSAMRTMSFEAQNAQIDDDGSGTSDWRDGALASAMYLGAAFVTGGDPPTIGDFARFAFVTSNTGLLWASGVHAGAGISEVFAYVIRPGSTPVQDRMEKVGLAYNSSTSRWEATYTNFDPSGLNTVIYYARDNEGNLSEPQSLLVDPGLIWVNFSQTGAEYGTQANPFNTLVEGVWAVNSGGTVRIFSGSAAGAIRITKPTRVESHGGTATIGR